MREAGSSRNAVCRTLISSIVVVVVLVTGCGGTHTSSRNASAPVAASASTAPPPDPAVVAFVQKMYPVYLAIPNAWSHVTSCASAEREFLPADVAACADADSAVIDAARALAKWLKDASVPPTLIDLRSKLVDAAEATDAGFTPRVAALRRGDRQAFNNSMSAAFNGLGQFCEPLQEVRPLDPGEQWPAVECN